MCPGRFTSGTSPFMKPTSADQGYCGGTGCSPAAGGVSVGASGVFEGFAPSSAGCVAAGGAGVVGAGVVGVGVVGVGVVGVGVVGVGVVVVAGVSADFTSGVPAGVAAVEVEVAGSAS